MKIPRRRFLHLAAGAVALPAVSPVAWAQTYPTRPISIVVGFAAGWPTDTIARIVGERMQTLLGQTVLIENVTGANGSIGVGRVVRAAPDGYTLSFGDLGTHVTNQVTYPLAYNIQQDLQTCLVSFYRPIHGGRQRWNARREFERIGGLVAGKP
jgi:tripartite-type tricarboxylate transporter receptor subunit TctC